MSSDATVNSSSQPHHPEAALKCSLQRQHLEMLQTKLLPMETLLMQTAEQCSEAAANWSAA